MVKTPKKQETKTNSNNPGLGCGATRIPRHRGGDASDAATVEDSWQFRIKVNTVLCTTRQLFSY